MTKIEENQKDELDWSDQIGATTEANCIVITKDNYTKLLPENKYHTFLQLCKKGMGRYGNCVSYNIVTQKFN